MVNIKNLVIDDLRKIDEIIANLIKNNEEIFFDLNNFISSKSKRIRSILALLYLKSNNVEITNDVLTLLSAGELIHNASLLHDDVIDDTTERRGKINIYGKYNSLLSVLSGDYILSVAVELLLKLNNTKILNNFVTATKNMSNAEIIQYQLRNKNITKEQYLSIIEGKTASLFKAITESSALLTGLDISNAGRLGKVFGMLFQINNDFSESSIKNDIKNGVSTAVTILGIENSSGLKDNYKEEIKELIEDYPHNIYKEGILKLTGNL